MVYITKNGKFIGKNKPSIEWRFHLQIYKKIPHVNSIIHNHPIYGTGFFFITKKNCSLSLSYWIIWWSRC